MGLDMYLAVEGGADPARVRQLVDDAKNDDGSPRFQSIWYPGGPAYAIGEKDEDPILAYWRKANAIHGWFVRELAGGVDECQRIPVTQQQLQDLHDRCKRVLDAAVDAEAWTAAIANEDYRAAERAANEAIDSEALADAVEKEGLAPTSGFFFGSYELDAWFVRDLQDTVLQLQKIFDTKGLGEASFVYQASW